MLSNLFGNGYNFMRSRVMPNFYFPRDEDHASISMESDVSFAFTSATLRQIEPIESMCAAQSVNEQSQGIGGEGNRCRVSGLSVEEVSH